MSLTRFNFQNNHENQSSVEPYYSPQSYQANSDNTIFRGSHRSCSLKKVFLKMLHAKFTEKHQCRSLLFHKVAGLSPANLLKKSLRRSCFSVNLEKFLKTHFLPNTSGRLILWFIEGRKT